MTYQESFESIRKKAEALDASKTEGHFAYQFNIEGEDEGIFYVEIKEGKVSAHPYDYIDNTAVISGASSEIEKYLSGLESSVKVESGSADVLNKVIEGSKKKEAPKAAKKETETQSKTAAKTTAAKAASKTTAAPKKACAAKKTVKKK